MAKKPKQDKVQYDPTTPKQRMIPVGRLKYVSPDLYVVHIVGQYEGYSDQSGDYEFRQYVAIVGDDSWQLSPPTPGRLR